MLVIPIPRHYSDAMRRTDRQLADRAAIDAVIRECRVCRVAMVDDGRPYVIPMCFGYDGRDLFLHGAPAGRKIDILRRNPAVCVEFDILDALVPAGPQGCNWTMRYRSVLAEGTAEFVSDGQRKRAALACMMAQYGTGTFTFPDAMVERTAVIRVALSTLTGKQSA